MLFDRSSISTGAVYNDRTDAKYDNFWNGNENCMRCYFGWNCTISFFSATEEFNFVIETMLPEKLKKFFSKYIIWSIIIAVLTCAVVCEGWSDENSNKNPYKGSKSAARTDSYINEMQIIQEKKMHVSLMM